MSIPGAASPLFLATTAGAADAFEISRSLRFNSGDSAYLNRTPSSAGNRKTWTWSGWVKRSGLDQFNYLFDAVTTNPATGENRISFENNEIKWYSNATTDAVETVGLFRDTAAWYHIVFAYNSTESTSSDRIKIYVNGVLQALTGSYPSQNAEPHINNTRVHRIGGSAAYGRYYDGCLAEINFIDGQALDPLSFAAFDDNGVWQAKDTAGLTFGTNGFRLKFADNSSNAALGTDSSGNSNTWTVNNLTTAAALNPTAQQNFDVVTYSGTSSTQSISSLGFQPDFIWFKARSYAGSHALVDSVRGVTKQLNSNSTATEGTNSAGNGLQSFDSNGFTLGNESNANGSTNGSQTYVAWCWKAGGAASSNSDGTITSSVSANTSYGFSVVTWTGDGSSSATVGHGLSSTPAWVVVKGRETTDSWSVYHSGLTSGHVVLLNSNSASFAASSAGGGGVGTPTSNTITFTNGSSSVNNVNQNTKDFVAYAWAEVAGFSKFGSYTGNNSSNSITTGFKPRWLLIKSSSKASTSWFLVDSQRGTSQVLRAHTSDAEDAPSLNIAFNANGFSLNTSNDNVNQSGETYIYAAYAATTGDAVGIDSLVDTPTNAAEPSDSGVGGEVVGNYATLNPLSKSSQTNIVLANGNLEASNTSSSGQGRVHGTIAMSSGKWYFEAKITGSSNFHEIGIIKTTEALTYGIGLFAGGYAYIQTGKKFNNNGDANYGASYTTGDIIGVAFDADNGTLAFYKNGASQGTAFTGLSGTYYPAVSTYSSGANFGWTVNFGQRAFAYQNAGTNRPSADYKTLNTANLPTPTIADGSKYFDTKLYTGNGGNNPQTGLGFSPDFVWLKNRSHVDGWHQLRDIVRGGDKNLASNATNAETDASNKDLDFDSNGFTLTGTSGSRDDNKSGDAYVAWAWDAGTSTVTNNDGSIASTVRANPSAGFSIVGYTGNGSAATIGHGLNAAPEMIIKKFRSATSSWDVYHASVGAGKRLVLNATDAEASTNSYQNVNSTTFDVHAGNNDSGVTMLALCFAPVAGYSAMGSYEGNGNSSGPFIYLGFKPALVILKLIEGVASSWKIYDNTRDPDNPIEKQLYPNSSNAEPSDDARCDFLSNGFKVRTAGSEDNYNNNTFIYYAVAENPFQANGGLAR